MPNYPFSALLLCGLVFCANLSTAQTKFSKVDEHARKVGFPARQNTAQLASELTAGLTTETDKARAIFVWITDNIRYDAKLLDDDDVESAVFKAKQQPGVVLRTKKAVCEGYANLFADICQAAGLKTVVATGVVKTPGGRIPRIGHAWNVVRADGNWQLIDATWGAGTLDEDMKYVAAFNEEYFFSDARSFLLNHFPTDPLFQLQEKPIDLATFKSKSGDRTMPANAPMIPHLKDSLNLFIGLDSAAARLNSALRILRFDPLNGYANFSLAMHHLETFNQLSHQYQTALHERVQKRVPLNLEQLKKDQAQLLLIQQNLDTCPPIVERIVVGDPYWRNGQAMLKTIAANKKTCQEALKNNQANQAKLKGKG